MQIDTRVLGPIEIEESQVVTFTEAMPGFSGYARFVVLNPDPESPFSYLQSVERPDLCFLMADPAQFFPAYRVELKKGSIEDLRIQDGAQAAVAVIVTVPEDPVAATANLLAPVVFNVEAKLARQVILEGGDHAVRQPLFQEQRQVSNGP